MSSMFKKEVMENANENSSYVKCIMLKMILNNTKTGIKTPRLQALPTMNLPLKSHEDTKVERKLPAFRIVTTTETDDVEGKEVLVYKDLDELHKRVQKCNWITEKWYTTYENNAVKITFNIEPHIVPYLEVVIDEKLQYTIIVFGWLLPNCHALYESHSRSVQTVTVSNLLREIMNNELCPGLPLEPKAMQGDKVISRVIPCRIDLKTQQHLPVSTKMFSRNERRQRVSAW